MAMSIGKITSRMVESSVVQARHDEIMKRVAYAYAQNNNNVDRFIPAGIKKPIERKADSSAIDGSEPFLKKAQKAIDAYKDAMRAPEDFKKLSQEESKKPPRK